MIKLCDCNSGKYTWNYIRHWDFEYGCEYNFVNEQCPICDKFKWILTDYGIETIRELEGLPKGGYKDCENYQK